MKTDTLAIWLNEKHEVNVRTKLTLEQNQNVRRHRTNYLSKSETSCCKHQDENRLDLDIRNYKIK